MLCADLWAINVIIIILSGILGVEDQATAVITYSIVLQFITFAHGTQDGACSLIKHQLSQQRVRLAKRYFKVISILTGSIVLVLYVLLAVFRRPLTKLFIRDGEEAVDGLTAKVIPVSLLFYLADGL